MTLQKVTLDWHSSRGRALGHLPLKAWSVT